jgi:hypothetical protein
MDGSREMGW